MNDNFDPTADEVRSGELFDLISPILFSETTPETQGATLVQLLAAYVAGHAPQVRERSLVSLTQCVRDLVPAFVDDMISRGIAPPEWREAVH